LVPRGCFQVSALLDLLRGQESEEQERKKVLQSSSSERMHKIRASRAEHYHATYASTKSILLHQRVVPSFNDTRLFYNGREKLRWQDHMLPRPFMDTADCTQWPAHAVGKAFPLPQISIDLLRGRLAASQAKRRMTAKRMSALHHCHAPLHGGMSILHRDNKPENGEQCRLP
jgi:hypothetical protein